MSDCGAPPRRHTRRLALRLHDQRTFDVVHASNPPDLLLPVVRTLKRSGSRFVFDHHDLAPELYLSRFGRGRDPVYCALLALERASFGIADIVVSTNETYRRVAIERGGKAPEDVFVVRNAPDPVRFQAARPNLALKQGREHLLAYVGVIAPQDGVDHGLRRSRSCASDGRLARGVSRLRRCTAGHEVPCCRARAAGSR